MIGVFRRKTSEHFMNDLYYRLWVLHSEGQCVLILSDTFCRRYRPENTWVRVGPKYIDYSLIINNIIVHLGFGFGNLLICTLWQMNRARVVHRCVDCVLGGLWATIFLVVCICVEVAQWHNYVEMFAFANEPLPCNIECLLRLSCHWHCSSVCSQVPQLFFRRDNGVCKEGVVAEN